MGENGKVGTQAEANLPASLTNQPDTEVDMAPTHSSKSKKAPAFQTYPADFLNDDAVEDMTFTEIGVYFVMLCKDWLGNGLPTSFEKIAKRISSGKHQVSESRMRKMWEGPISRCFDEKDGRLYNPRLEFERKKHKNFLRRQTDNGALGGRPRKTHIETQAFSDSKPRARAPRDETNRDETKQVVQEEKKRQPDFDGQRGFMALKAVYPSHRFVDDQPTQSEFVTQVFKDGDPHRSFAEMLDNLENHKASEEWGRGVIPSVFTWLSKGKWRGRYADSPTTSTGKTAGNMAALQRFIDRGRVFP